MGESERIELSTRELRIVANLMADNINDNIDKHLGEAVEVHSMALRNEFKEIHKIHVEEVTASLEITFDAINSIKLEQIQLRSEMNAFKEAYPVMGAYINITKKVKINFRKALIWVTIGVILACGLFKLTHE